MRTIIFNFTFVLITILFSNLSIYAQNYDITAAEIIERSQDNVRGDTHQATIKMSIVRPKYTREMVMKSWSLGEDYALIAVEAPAREKGTAFLKRQDEIYNWVPNIGRVVKLPPSMMMQSWMGSDFTNDDLVRAASILEDYSHEIEGEENIAGYDCYKIVLTPKPDAPVVWGKIVSWFAKDSFIELRAEFYDEDEYLINEMVFSNIKEMNGRKVPTLIEVIPVDDEGNKTQIEYIDIKFNEPIEPSFFSQQRMKNALR